MQGYRVNRWWRAKLEMIGWERALQKVRGAPGNSFRAEDTRGIGNSFMILA